MKKRHVLMVMVGALFLLLVGVAVAFTMDEGFVPSRADGLTPNIGGSHSVMPQTFDTINTWTDAVVVGTVTEKTSGLVPCCDSIATRVATHLPGQPGPTRLQDTITFSVESIYKGTAPATVTIKTERPGGSVIRSGDDVLELMDFQVGGKYVLFLIARDGYYAVQGYYRGMWAVDGDVATQLGTGETLSTTEINERVRE